jgi:hypothetical protein
MTVGYSSSRLIFSGLAGIVLGYVGGPVQILALWAVIGIGIGYSSAKMRAVLLNGVTFGFIVSFVFMLHGYKGADPIVTKLVPFAVLGVFGALCGIMLVLIGSLLKGLLRKKYSAEMR